MTYWCQWYFHISPLCRSVWFFPFLFCPYDQQDDANFSWDFLFWIKIIRSKYPLRILGHSNKIDDWTSSVWTGTFWWDKWSKGWVPNGRMTIWMWITIQNNTCEFSYIAINELERRHFFFCDGFTLYTCIPLLISITVYFISYACIFLEST